MKPDQERVRGLLTDTVTLLCKNGLQYSKELKVQGLLGITLDNDDVFVVHINEIFDGLVGGQVSGIQSGDSITSAIVAADSATQPIEREPSVGKSRKSTPHKHGIPRTSSPMLQGSSKRKASLKAPIMRIKKEDDDDDVVVMDSAKSEADNTTDFIPASTDLSGDGDREAMRMSYGGVEMENDAPPTKRRASDCKGSDSFSDQAETVSGAPFITGIVRNNTESDMLGNNSSLDGSQLSSVGQMGDGQVVFDNTPGCSAWDSSQLAEGNGDSAQDPGSQDSFQTEPLSGDDGLYTRFMSRSGTHHAPKRPSHDTGAKEYCCDYPGCGKSFFHRHHLLRHQTNKHGRVPRQKSTFLFGMGPNPADALSYPTLDSSINLDDNYSTMQHQHYTEETAQSQYTENG